MQFLWNHALRQQGERSVSLEDLACTAFMQMEQVDLAVP
jgi:hypothetical protein